MINQQKKQKSLKYSNISVHTRWMFTAGLFCIVFIFSLACSGCKKDADVLAVEPGGANSEQFNKILATKSRAEERVRQLREMAAGLTTTERPGDSMISQKITDAAAEHQLLSHKANVAPAPSMVSQKITDTRDKYQLLSHEEAVAPAPSIISQKITDAADGYQSLGHEEDVAPAPSIIPQKITDAADGYQPLDHEEDIAPAPSIIPQKITDAVDGHQPLSHEEDVAPAPSIISQKIADNRNGRQPLSHEASIAPAHQTNLSASTVAQIDTILAADTPIATAEYSTGKIPVYLPALTEPGMAEELISINFDQVDIRIMLKTIGEITGINFIVDDSVKGTVTVMSPTKMRLGRIYEILESVLDVKGYAAVPSGDLVKIVPKEKAAKGNLQVRIGSDPMQIPKNDSLVTQIIPLTFAEAAEVGQIIQPMLAAGANMSTYPRTNSILITGTSSNIYHIARVIQKLDVSGSKEKVTLITLRYASAEVLSEQITKIMDKSNVAATRAARNRNVPQVQAGIKILPDPRTNSMVVVANAQDTATIQRLTMQLDVQRSRGTSNVHVVYLKNAPAKETAQSLTAALTDLRIAGTLDAAQNVQVTADEGTNGLIITASAQDFEVIAEIIDKLDIIREQVLVEMLIMEISEDSLEEIGIDWATLDGAVAGSVRAFGATNFGVRVDSVAGTLEGLTIGAFKKNGSDTSIGPLLHALEKVSGVNILSTPHILASNHNRATIIVGENIPYVIESRITETTDFLTPTVIDSFAYKDVGISLEIVPHISQGGLVRLEIDTEFTKLIEGVTGSSVNTPTTAIRQAQTVVTLNSGSTVVIGGLIRDDKVTLDKSIPIISDIPLIGNLFKSKSEQLQKTNLLLFITPHILAGQQELEQITERKRQEVNSAVEGLGEIRFQR